MSLGVSTLQKYSFARLASTKNNSAGIRELQSFRFSIWFVCLFVWGLMSLKIWGHIRQCLFVAVVLWPRCCHTGISCHRHRTWHPTQSQYSNTGPNCEWVIRRCGTSHWNTQLPILRSRVRHYQEILPRPSTHCWVLNPGSMTCKSIILSTRPQPLLSVWCFELACLAGLAPSPERHPSPTLGTWGLWSASTCRTTSRSPPAVGCSTSHSDVSRALLSALQIGKTLDPTSLLQKINFSYWSQLLWHLVGGHHRKLSSTAFKLLKGLKGIK